MWIATDFELKSVPVQVVEFMNEKFFLLMNFLH